MKLIFLILIAAVGLFFISDIGPSLISNVKTQLSNAPTKISDLLPGEDPYQLGVKEGIKFKSDRSYVDQINILPIPGAALLIQKVKNGEINQTLLEDLANIYWPVAALKSGIIDISAENRAKFRQGVIDGYFDQAK